MTQSRQGRLPHIVLDTWAVLSEYFNATLPDGTRLPLEMKNLSDAIFRSSQKKTPKASLNRSLTALQRKNAGFYVTVNAWLNDDSARLVFSACCQMNTLLYWQSVFSKLVAGSPVRSAFSFPNGRPRNLGFSHTHDAALAAEYFQKIGGVRSDKATLDACAMVGPARGKADSELSCRDVQAYRMRLKTISLDNLEEQYKIIKEKYSPRPSD